MAYFEPSRPYARKSQGEKTWSGESPRGGKENLLTELLTVLGKAETFYDGWPTKPTDDKRKIAEALMKRNIIGEGEMCSATCLLLKNWAKTSSP